MYVALKSRANGKFVRINSTSQPLMASALTSKEWDAAFAMVDLGSNCVALLGYNGKYVCADNAGASPLIANRIKAADWETFEKVNAGGGIALKARANGKYVCAEDAGLAALIANRNAVGTWETFDLIDLSTTSVGIDGPSLQAAHINFMTQDDGKDNDSTIYIRVYDAGTASLLACANGVCASQNAFDAFPAWSQHTVYLTVACGTPKSSCVNPAVCVGIQPVGNDTWRFKAQLTLKFSDNTQVVLDSPVSTIAGSNSLYASATLRGTVTV